MRRDRGVCWRSAKEVTKEGLYLVVRKRPSKKVSTHYIHTEDFRYLEEDYPKCRFFGPIPQDKEEEEEEE